MIHIIMLKDYDTIIIYMNLSNTKGSSNKHATIKVFVGINYYTHTHGPRNRMVINVLLALEDSMRILT